MRHLLVYLNDMKSRRSIFTHKKHPEHLPQIALVLIVVIGKREGLLIYRERMCV